MDLRRQLAVLRSWARWIVLGTVLAAVAAFGASQVLPRVYEADTRILVGQALESSSPNVDQFQSAQNLARTYAEIASSRTLLQRVMDSVGIDGPVEGFARRIVISTSVDQPFVDVLARGDTPEEAATIANTLATELLSLAGTVASQGDVVLDFIDDDLAAIQAQVVDIREEIAELVAGPRTVVNEDRLLVLEDRLVRLLGTYAALIQARTGSDSNRLTVIDEAVPPLEAASPRPLLNTVLAGIIGLLLIIAVAFVWETLDDRLRTAEDVERVTGLGVLARIVKMPGERGRKEIYRLATLLYPRSPVAEAFRTLRTNLEFAALDERYRSIVVTSAAAHEGKTVVAANLAIAYAQNGRSVILVDADLRQPAVHGMFGLYNELGLTDLARSEELAIDEVLQATEVPGLRILTAGTIPANPAELLGSQRNKGLMARLVSVADHVVIDTAPVGVVTDAALLAADADATVLVVRESFASERVIRRGRDALAAVNAHVVGVVLNFVRPRAGESEPYFGTYTDDRPGTPDARGAASPAGRSR